MTATMKWSSCGVLLTAEHGHRERQTLRLQHSMSTFAGGGSTWRSSYSSGLMRVKRFRARMFQSATVLSSTGDRMYSRCSPGWEICSSRAYSGGSVVAPVLTLTAKQVDTAFKRMEKEEREWIEENGKKTISSLAFHDCIISSNYQDCSRCIICNRILPGQSFENKKVQSLIYIQLFW